MADHPFFIRVFISLNFSKVIKKQLLIFLHKSKIFIIFVSVNQQVDIEQYLQEFRSEIGRLNKTVSDLTEDNARLNRRVEAQNVEIKSLKSDNADLRDKLSKYEDPEPPKNSGNSSVPPSKEKMGDEIKRRTNSLREKSGKKPGGQPGHEGNTRMMSETPDETEDIQPNYCRECGRDLSGIEGTEEYREECVGVRIMPIVKRVRFLNKTCTCGCCNRIDYKKRKNPVYLSSEIRALVVYFNVVMCMPYNRIKSFLYDVMHIDLSEGSIRNFIEDAGEKADSICDRIASELTKSPVAGADESGFYVNGKLNWAWILQNPRLTLTWIAKGRGAKEMDDRFGKNALENTVLTTDRHSAYFTMNVKGHQVCIPHLLRNLNYLNELDKKQNWSARLQELLRNAVHWRNKNPEAVADTSTWMASLDKLLNENLDNFKKPFRQLRNSLRKLRDHVFHFLKDTRVPSHNNDSESGIRILKVKQKRSGGFRSQGGAEDFMAIHSVTDTAKKNEFSRWDAVMALV